METLKRWEIITHKLTESNAVSNVETMYGNSNDGSTYASNQAELPTVKAKLLFLLYWPRAVNCINVFTKAALSAGPKAVWALSEDLQPTSCRSVVQSLPCYAFTYLAKKRSSTILTNTKCLKFHGIRVL